MVSFWTITRKKAEASTANARWTANGPTGYFQKRFDEKAATRYQGRVHQGTGPDDPRPIGQKGPEEVIFSLSSPYS
ncbi:hypothetical protein EMIT07CA2_70110 [Brevibacillus sp. IT-7CA2]